ncbi:MAG: Glyoxalase/Bleomycin resistance protein/Dioxygenase superfamily protein [Frondihabitans sp.]|nr:Glyoxalase/Bleomycin resistance protein/Dioxygenase superfamily protein [Frondihabitans sp.]
MRLAALGFAHFATLGTRPLLNHGPSGTVIQLCDLHSDRPQLRDLFPPSSEFAGPPILDSNL